MANLSAEPSVRQLPALNENQEMYESGNWIGHWDQKGLGRQEMHDLSVRFDGDLLEGRGWDCVGEFTLQGQVKHNAEVELIKTYQGRHSVVYRGRHDGEGMVHGVWALDGDNGTWAIRPKGGFRRSEAPIDELRP